MASMDSSGPINVQSWPLERYAKYVIAQVSQESAENQNEGHWKQFSSQDGASSIQISLLESNNLIVSDGKVIHESFSLYNASHWLKAAAKGDSMLFLYRMNNDTRRFRIKFDKSDDRSALENCADFVSKIKSHITVKEIPIAAATESQVQIDDSQQVPQVAQTVSNTPTKAVGAAASVHTKGEGSGTHPSSAGASGVSLPDLAAKALSPEFGWGAGLTTSKEAIPPSDELSAMVRLCLSDANFPAFVEAVENELLKLAASSES